MAGAAAATNTEPATVSVSALQTVVAALFAGAGLKAAPARAMAEALIEADQQNVGSHGVAMVPMYVERLELGSITTAERATLVRDQDAIAVFDAGHMLGHLAAEQAMATAIEKACQFGLGAAAVRRGFHFGLAGRYAAQAAQAGCIGVAMCNTRPMMAAPGGLEPVVGNNPLAIAAPTESGAPILLDMAMSEVALARVRAAARRGDAIPPTWAVGPDGAPTTDPHVALSGMLAPVGGGKGFALALLIDILCGLLSSGATGGAVKPLFGDLKQPNDCSFLFVALDIAHFRSLAGFLTESEAVRTRVSSAPNRSGKPGFAPGDERTAAMRAQSERVTLDWAVLEPLIRFATGRGVDTSALFLTAEPKSAS